MTAEDMSRLGRVVTGLRCRIGWHSPWLRCIEIMDDWGWHRTYECKWCGAPQEINS